MKSLKALVAVLAIAVGAQSASAQQVQIDIDIDVDSNDFQLADNAISIQVGIVKIARPFVKMENGSIRIGSEVITSRMNKGTVTGFFPSTKKLVVSEDGWGTQQFALEQIAVRNGCNGALCVNDQVLTSRNNQGTVLGFFSNGDVVVKEEGWGIQRLVPDNVAPGFGCTSFYCVGDQVITHRNNGASVLGFFPNGDISVKEEGWGVQRINRANLALTRALCANIYINRVGVCQ